MCVCWLKAERKERNTKRVRALNTEGNIKSGALTLRGRERERRTDRQRDVVCVVNTETKHTHTQTNKHTPREREIKIVKNRVRERGEVGWTHEGEREKENREGINRKSKGK